MPTGDTGNTEGKHEMQKQPTLSAFTYRILLIIC